MKKFLLTKLLLTILSLASTPLLAHSGHLSGESMHGFLHIEHIIALAAIGVIAVFVSVLRNK